MRKLVAIVAVVILIASARANEPSWDRTDDEHGVVIESRDVPGTALHDLRAAAKTTAPVATVLGVLWSHADFVKLLPRVKHIEILRDSGDERLVYQQFQTPVLKDRDIVLRITRRRDGDRVEIDSVAVTDEGPPERPDHVRVRTSRAHWTLAPTPDGGTALTYQIRADIGGSVPAWIVNRAQREGVPDLVHAIVTEAERRTR
jgi:hypothetical protein